MKFLVRVKDSEFSQNQKGAKNEAILENILH